MKAARFDRDQDSWGSRILILGTAIAAGAMLMIVTLLAQKDSKPIAELKITGWKAETALDGAHYLNLTFIRSDDPANSIYDVDVSSDLRQWRTLEVDELEEQPSGVESQEQQQTVRVRVDDSPPGATLRDYRIKISKEALQFRQAPLLPPPEEGTVNSQAVNTSSATDVTASTQVQFSGIFHNRRTLQSTVNASIKNTSAAPIPNPIYLVITSISEPSITVANADDTNTDGKPLFDFSAQVPGGTLDPAESTSARPLVFNNPLLRPFTVTVSVLQGSTAPAGAVTLALTTDGNQSVIMMSEPPPFSGIPRGIGEELTVTVKDSVLPTQVQLAQVQAVGGRGQIFFGLSGTAVATTVTTSGGNPNQAKVPLRYSASSAFKGDINLVASINGQLQGQKSVTAISISISPKCIYLSDQRPVKQTLTVNPALPALKFTVHRFAVYQDIAHSSDLDGGTTTITTGANGTSTSSSRHPGYDAYFVAQISPERTPPIAAPLPTMLHASSSADSPVTSPSGYCDKNSEDECHKKGDPLSYSITGDEQYTCPSPSPSDGYGHSVDISDGEKKRTFEDLTILGRGMDYEFRRLYRSFNYRRAFGHKDFGENWVFSYADEYLVKDGSGADEDANYINFRDGNSGNFFVRTGPGVWGESVQQFVRLRINPTTRDLEIRDRTGMVRVYYNFSSPTEPKIRGRLKEIRDRNGNVMRFLYAQPAGLSKFVLTTVVDTMGRSIFYRYYLDSDPSPGRRGRLMEVEDFRRDNSASGRKLKFDYDAEGNLVSGSSPIVQGTPNGNDFPNGKTYRYKYITIADLPGTLTQEQRDQLLHKLTHIWHPNEVGNNPAVNPADNLAAERVTYDVDSTHSFFGFATVYSIGGVNANGVPAGGTIRFTYSDLNPTRGMSPGVNLNHALLINLQSLKVAVQDRNGNQAEYIFGGERKMLEYSEITRGLRKAEPAKFTISYAYNKDRLLTQRTMPEGNFTIWTYDEGNPDRYQQANVLQIMRVADSKRGGDQGRIVTRYVYDPVYNQPCLIIEPRGTDSSFIPPFGGPASPSRYATSYTFDYQEGPNLDAHIQRLADVLGVDLSTMKQIIERNEAQVEEALGFAPGSVILLGKGDVNGDGLTDQIHGNHLQKFSPTVNLLPGSNQAAIEGDTIQEIAERFIYNKFGQMLSRRDPELNVHTSEFFAETDPDGDGSPTAAPADGRTLDAATGGYLKQTTMDTASNPLRDNRMNPAPVNIRTSYAYDDVGNVVRMTNGRLIRTDYLVNELNQVVQTTRAAAVPAQGSGSPPEPISLTAFAYRDRVAYDFNNNVTGRQVEDRGDTSNTGGFVDSTSKYDILNRQIEMSQEVNVGKSLITRYRYDPNENRVMTIHPAGNAESVVYDERDLVLTSTRGASTRSANGLFAAADPISFDRPGGLGTLPSTSTYNYDANKNRIELVDAENNGGAKSAIAGGVGDVTRYTYDGLDRRKSFVDPLGNLTSYSYDPASNVIRVRQDGDPVDDVAGSGDNKTLAATEYIHDELSRVVATHRVLFLTPDVTTARPSTLTDTAAMDSLAPYLADANSDTAPVPGATGIAVIGRVTSLTEYDRIGRSTFTIQDDLDAYRTDYDGAGRIIRTVDDALNNGNSGTPLVPTFNPALLSGNTVENAYDDNNNIVEMLETDVTEIPDVPPEQFRTTYLYDSLDRLQSTFNNRGHTTDYRYDSRNNLVATADAQGPVSTRTANRRGLGSSASVALNDFGNVIRNFYDGANRLLLTETILTATGQGDGLHIGATLEGVKSTPPPPDPNQSEDGKISVWRAYDNNSELLALRDDDGNTTGYIYDNENRLVKDRKGMNAGFQSVAFAITSGDSGAFNEPRTPPDPLKDPPVETEAGNTDNGTTITYAYDRDNNLVQVLDEATNVRNYTYDALNRRKTLGIVRAPGFIGTTSQSWKYDGLGRLDLCVDNNEPGQVEDDVLCTDAYDSLNRKIQESQKIGALSAKVVSFDYEIDCSCGGSVGLPSTCTYPDGRRVHSSYDRLDRLVSRNDEGFSDIGRYQYIGKNRIAVLIYQNGTRLTHIRQAAGQNADLGFDNLRRIVNHRWESFAPGVTPLGNGTLVVGFGHQNDSGVPAYDRMNNKLIEEKLHDPGNSEVYVYDSAYRLADPGASDYRGISNAFRRGTPNPRKTDIATLTITAGELQKQDWTLDGLGNWTQNIHTTQGGVGQIENRTHSDFNEIVALSGIPYGGGVTGTHVLDKNGNLTDDGVRSYAWDALNRLRTVKKKSNGNVLASYAYDCSNRRMRKVISNSGIDGTAINGTRDFYYDGWRVIEERLAADAITRQYVCGNYIDEVWTIESRAGVTVAQLNNGTGDQRHFYAYNTLYSVHALNDQTGSLKEGYQYEAYGKRTILTPTWAVKAVQTSAVENQNGFTSRYHDAETGLVYFRARIYAPLIGRFISRDPISSGPKSQMGQGVNHDISLRNMQRVQYSFAPKAQQIVASYQADFIPNYTDPSGLLPDKPQQTCKIGPCTDAEIKAASDACDSAQGFYDQALRAVALVSFAAGLELGANIGADIGVGIAIDYAATCGKARDAACSADCCRGSENCHEANPPPPLPPMPVPFDTSKLGWEMLAR